MELKHPAFRHVDEIHSIMERILIELIQAEDGGAGFLEVLVVYAAADGTPIPEKQVRFRLLFALGPSSLRRAISSCT